MYFIWLCLIVTLYFFEVAILAQRLLLLREVVEGGVERWEGFGLDGFAEDGLLLLILFVSGCKSAEA